MNLIQLATKYDDSFDWKKIIPLSKEADGYMIHATALSTILPDSDSVLLGVYLVHKKTGQSEYLNLRARWDRGDEARLCGFPGEYSLWNDEDTNEDASVHVTQYMEYVMLSEAKRTVQNQFRRKHCNVKKPERTRIIQAFNRALEYLSSKQPAREALIERLTGLLENEHYGCSDNTCIINKDMMESFPTHVAECFSSSGAASGRFQRLTSELLALYGKHYWKQIRKECTEICRSIPHTECPHCNAVIWDFDGQYSESEAVRCDSCGSHVDWKPEKE